MKEESSQPQRILSIIRKETARPGNKQATSVFNSLSPVATLARLMAIAADRNTRDYSKGD